MARISKCRKYVIDVAGLYPLSLGELRGSSVLPIFVLLNVLGR